MIRIEKIQRLLEFLQNVIEKGYVYPKYPSAVRIASAVIIWGNGGYFRPLKIV